MKSYAQGDVLLIPVTDIEPTADQIVAAKDGMVVLAEGRTTAHPHVFRSGAVLFRGPTPVRLPPAGRHIMTSPRALLKQWTGRETQAVPIALYIGHVNVAATGALLEHGRAPGTQGDHDPLQVPGGSYVALRQREYHAGEALIARTLGPIGRDPIERPVAPAVSSEAQALIDRMRAFDPARPRLDRARAEDALRRHFTARGFPAPPIVWSPDLASGYRHMIDLALAAIPRDASHGLALDIARDISDVSSRADRIALDTALEGASAMALDLARRVVDANSHADHGAVKTAANEVGGDHVAAEAARQAANAAVQIALADADLVISSIEAAEAAEKAVQATAGAATEDDVWLGAYYGIADGPTASWGARRACMELNALAVFDHPAQRRLVDIWLPMMDAFEAALWCYWITPNEVLCVPRPVLHIVNNHLHRADGPAVEWPTGERYWLWRGVPVPQWLIEEPSRITPSVIRGERQLELRRCMIERFGVERFFRETVPRPAREDRYGKLWRCDFGDDDPYTAVEVEDGTTGPDGRRRKHFLSVPPEMRTAHEAVAWSYGLAPEQYDIATRT
jgi:hypothetical protein